MGTPGQVPDTSWLPAGRQNKRAKGCTEANGSTTKKKGSHQCPICKDYGHRWYNCKDDDPEDIAAMLAEKGPPKRRKKTTECESSIVPADPGPKTMHFPPSQNASLILDSGNSLKSGSGSNQPETLSIEYPLFTLGETTPPAATSMPIVEKKGKMKAKAQGKKKQQQVTASTDSPVMGT